MYHTRSKVQQAPHPPSPIKMSLRSFRNVPLVPMESSSSSSDDSCDSFGSDGGFTITKKACLKLKRVVVKPSVFEATTEEETVSVFEDDAFNSEMGAMNVDSDSESAEPPRRRGRPSKTLTIAMKFPTKRGGQRKRPASEPLPQPKQDSDSEEGENFLEKRALNIKENKAMLAKLMAELNKERGLFPGRTSMLGNMPRRSYQRRQHAVRVVRAARPHTRSRSLVDGPPQEQPEEESEDEPEDKFGLVRQTHARMSRGRVAGNMQCVPHVVRPVEDVSQYELDMICYNGREKVYNQVTGATCHQCRQKTIDTKTTCRNPECWGVRGQFCGPCLRNRYGEEVRDALLDPEWMCPPCRGICNCSFCRAREGRCATGILIYLAKHHGYDNAHAYLKSLRKELEESQ